MARTRDEDDEDDERPAPRAVRAPHRPPHAGDMYGSVKWALLVLGAALAVTATAVGAVQAGPLAGLACFLGIAARVMQAEQHRYPK